MALCGEQDWNVSAIFCSKDHPPVLPTCFQHSFISLIPIVFVIFGFIQGFNITRRKKLKFRRLRPLTNIRLSVIGGLIISQLCILVQGSQIELIQQISAGIILAFLIVLAVTVFCQDLSQTVSIPAAFYFWILFLLSRAPLVPLIHIDNSLNEVVRISHFVSFILGIFGFVLEWFPLKFEGQHASTPEEKSSHTSILFYGWLDPLFWKGLKEPLTKEKIPGLQRDMTVNRVLEKFGKRKPMDPSVKFEGERNVAFSAAANKDDVFVEIGDLNRIEKNENVVKTLAKTFGKTFLAAAFMKLIQDLLKFVVPIILKDLIKFVKDSNSDSTCESSPWVGYFYAVSIFIIGIVNSVLLQAYWKKTHSVALRVRTSLFSDIYAKSLTLNPTSRKEYTVGEIVTLMSTDAQTFKQVIPSLNMVWSMPLQIVLAIYFLYHELGPSVFGGVVVLVLLVPFNTFMGKKSQAVNREQLKSKDKRVRRIYELLNSLKIVKLYAWENLFDKRVQECRDTEIRFLKKNAILKAMINFVFGSAPILVTLVSFAIYVSVDAENVLTPEKAFVCLTLFSMLRLPINLLPNILTEIFRLNVSIKRVNKFLSCENITKYVEILNPTTNPDVDIDIKNGEFAWNDGPTFLHNINLSVKTGTLYAIAGPTGSGKSSLLAAILGQMTHKGGKIGTANKRMAYVSQEAWIQNRTIKENILFGRPMDQAFYRKVIQSCALEDDFWILPEGDSTMIGENGVNLSGGQKQRISLARAVYSNADIYLLDDCLSAVDVHVGSHLTECVLGRQGILAGKTRIMVTHNQGVINIADRVKYMKDGTFDLNIEPNNKESHLNDEKEVCEEKKTIENCCNGVLRDELEEKISEKNAKNEVKEKSTDDKAKDIQDRLKDKSVGSGSAFISAYKMYLSHFGFLNIIVVLVLYVFNQGLITGSSIWLTYWSDQSEKGAIIQKNITVPVAKEFGRNASENIIVPFNNDFYIGVYGAIGIGTSVCAFLRNLLLFVSAAGASKSIHSRLFKSVIKGQLGFFESSSSGSVVSRFSSDMDATDSMIPNQISAFLFNTFEVLAVIVTISYSSPEFLIAVIPIVFIFYGIKIFYIRTSRQLKRLESSSNSPIYAHFNETIRGISSIKAFDEVPRFVQEFGDLISANLRFSYYSVMCGRWLGLRTEMVAQILVLAASLVAVIHRDSFSSGWAGLIISLALSITETFNWVLICFTNLEDQATVVQRIKELTKHIPQEKNWTSENPPPKSWPSRGVIEFENYSTGYSSDVDVLKNLVFKSESGEKLAIVGRTGAGKSSMVLACLRILEAKEGRILIDDVDISKIGLHELRTAITIIPQDPVLFTGSLRENVDPERKKTDEDISSLMKTANLEKYSDLNLEVEEGGANFSQGEKQLICLVRALCRGTRVVIMDEATASVDAETDASIQKMFKEEFKLDTVMTIAHRLNTIMDYDRVMVMESGVIKEIGNPSDLANTESSLFHNMIHSK